MRRKRTTGLDGLFRVTTKGLGEGFTAYVVASDPTAASEAFSKLLDDQKYGFPKERELVSVTLIARERAYISSDASILLVCPREEEK